MTTLDEALAAIRKQTKDRKELMDTLPKREWVGLTDEEVNDLYNAGMGIHATIEATEAKLKEKNHG